MSRSAPPGLFTPPGIPLLAGRLFEASDRIGAGRVVLVNQAHARDMFGKGSAIDGQIGFDTDLGMHDQRVNGVIQDRGYRKFRPSHAAAGQAPFRPARSGSGGWLAAPLAAPATVHSEPALDSRQSNVPSTASIPGFLNRRDMIGTQIAIPGL